jgi:hypothetical protein
MIYNDLYERAYRFGLTPPALKICTRSIVVRRTTIEHGRSKSAHQQHDMRARSEHRTDAAQDLHMLLKFAATICNRLQLHWPLGSETTTAGSIASLNC